MANTLKRNIIISFGFSLLLLLLSSIASYISIRSLISSSGWVDHTNKTIADLEKVNALMLESETNQRGYLLTKDPGFLVPYEANRELILEKVKEIRKNTIDNPGQTQQADHLAKQVELRLEILATSIQLSNEGKPETEASIVRGREAMAVAKDIVSKMEETEQLLLMKRVKAMEAFSTYTPILILIAAALSVLITVFFYIRIVSDFKKREGMQRELQQKDADTNTRIMLIQSLTNKISAGNYKIRVGDAGQDLLGSLSGDLNKMAESLDYSFSALSEKEWLQAGVAGLNEQMLGEKDVNALSDRILQFVAEYTHSNVGALYLTDDLGRLSLTSGFALSPDVAKVVNVGQGFAGQCAKMLKRITLENVPEENFNISFTSGNVRPGFLVAFPIIHENKLKGVVELGAMTAYNDNENNFFDTVSWQTGVSITGAQSRRKLQELLEETQSQSEELHMQHSEMENINEELKSQSQKLQVSEEELKVQQEELMQTNTELEERTIMLEEKNQLIEERNQNIQATSRELERTTRYKSEFLANMSHELRTPLNSILLLSRLMVENNEQKLNNEQVEFAKVIQSSGQGLLSLIDEILDLSKIESGKMEMEYLHVSIREIANDLRALFAPMAKEKGIQFSIEMAAEVPEQIVTDKMRLEQILKNLLSNALKFTSRGFVSLSISKTTDETELLMNVKDSGIGIPSDKQKIVFDAFQQADGSTRRQYGGTGLGLSISRELTKLLGGRIELLSEPGRGSEFRLYIPVTKPEEAEENPVDGSGLKAEAEKHLATVGRHHPSEIPGLLQDDRNHLAHNDKVILIIEDDISFAKTLLEFSRQRGFKGVVASQGDHGVELATLLRPAGILLDIKLPVKDGWQVMKELKENSRTRNIPIHTMSSSEIKNKSIHFGAVDFISKPAAYDKMEEVFQRIESILKSDPNKVMIVEEDAHHARALAWFLENFNISAEIKNDIPECINALLGKEVNCVILNMGVPYDKSYDNLKEVKLTQGLEHLPIIIFTGKSLSRTEEKRIRQYADSIVVKTAHSYQRILDEVSLFLHLMEENREPHDAGANYRKLGALTEVLRNKKVLIADDDVRNIFSLSKALEAIGMQIASAIDGKEALQQLKDDRAIDVVLMDMMMPEMDGYETMRAIRQTPGISKIPIIAVTAKAMGDDREKCIEAGASDYITKPVDKDQLLSLLRVWLYEKG